MDWQIMIARIASSTFLLHLIIIQLPIVSMIVPEKNSSIHVHTRTVSIQETPTVDPTTTVLTKEKLTQEVNQLEHQNERSLLALLWNNASTLFSILVVVGSAFFGLYRWVNDRRTEREKESEERFQSVVEGLGGERTEMKVGGAIVLRTFLLPDYTQFYRQVFDLAVAHLRLQHHTSSKPSLSLSIVSQALATLRTAVRAQPQELEDLDVLTFPDPLSQALATVFKESFPLVRDWLKQGMTTPRLFSFQGILIQLSLKKRTYLFKPQLLDATAIQLNNAHLSRADLKEIWMPEAHLAGADLTSAEFNGANLSRTNFTQAHLERADLSKANLIGATFTGAFLNGAQFPQAILEKTKFNEADLKQANFAEAIIRKGIFTGADLTGADFTKAKLAETNLLDAKSLSGAKIHDVLDITEEQLEGCRKAGASVVRRNA